MEKLFVRGGRALSGRVRVSGAKNAVLPIIAAALLGETPTRLEDVPNLDDVQTISAVLSHLGGKIQGPEDGVLHIDCSEITGDEAPYELVSKMRAAFLVIGPLLARTGRAQISLPGGCAIGARPIDLHLKGLKGLGAIIEQGPGHVTATAPPGGLIGGTIYLDFPSVGATENLIMAATLAKGKTVIENAAEEPEIVDLANFLTTMGAKIKGAGTNVIRIEGVPSLRGGNHQVIPDRIEAGTYMIAAAMTKGHVRIDNAIAEHLQPVVAKMREAGVLIQEDVDGITVDGRNADLKSVDIKTLPYPGFPTDVQAQFMALLTLSKGSGIVSETVFENRFMHVNELQRMGAAIRIEGRSAVVDGPSELLGCKVNATDLRAGAALVLAGMAATGETEIGAIHHIDRGYENLVDKLTALGADIRRGPASDADGCSSENTNEEGVI